MPPHRYGKDKNAEEFDPSAPATVHDRVNDRTFEWSTDSRAHYEKYAKEVAQGVISWDRRMLDGWQAVVTAR
jgi:hypothetical protein